MKFPIAVGLWKVAVITGEPQRETAASDDSQKETSVTGHESNKQEEPASVDESRDKRDDVTAEQQPLKPTTDSDGEENTDDNGNSRDDNDEQDEAAAQREERFSPTCRLVIVLYGDQGKTQPLLLGHNESVSEMKFQPGIADTFIVSQSVY